MSICFEKKIALGVQKQSSCTCDCSWAYTCNRHARTYLDEAVVEVEADEAGGDAGVGSEGGRDGLPDDGLGVGAGGVVEPHAQLRAAVDRQLQAQHGGEQHRQTGQAAAAAARHGHRTL